MQNIAEITKTKKFSPISTTDRKKFNPTDSTISTNSINRDEIKDGYINRGFDNDHLYEQYKDLCGDVRFRPFYIQAFYKLGKEKVMSIASTAKADGKNPPAYFGFLIKKELSKC